MTSAAGNSDLGNTTVQASSGSERADLRDRVYLLVFHRESSFMVPLGDGDVVVIGRATDAGIVLPDDAVSRRHAEVCVQRGIARVSDLESQNGTRVNDAEIGEPHQLANGDVITIGSASLVFHGHARPSAAPAEELTFRVGDESIIVADPVMKRLYALVTRLAQSDLPVLVYGETGTGKELTAVAVHAKSKRANQPLLTLNCAAIQENLVESELFGHQRGAFSGAVSDKQGLLETAAGGTVFLDEIGELPPSVQAKLLRVLETKRFTRVGDVVERQVDFRLVAATNRNLKTEVSEGRFRHDLYFRLNGATLWIPPLREREVELPILARRFLANACTELQREPLCLDANAEQALADYSWPGNVRELKLVMEYLAATNVGDTISAEEVQERLDMGPDSPTNADAGSDEFRPLQDEVRELEIRRISDALEAAGGVQTRAAELIGMPLRTLVAKVKRYNLANKKRE